MSESCLSLRPDLIGRAGPLGPDGELERLEVGEVERVPVGVRLIWSGLMGGEIGGIPSWRVEPERERPEPF